MNKDRKRIRESIDRIERYEQDISESMDEIVSIDREISDELDDIKDEISDAYYELEEFFQFSHAEQMWIHEKQLEVLTGFMKQQSEIGIANQKYEIAIQSLKLGLIDESLNKLKEAVKINPNDHRIYMAMGYIYLMADNLDKAWYILKKKALKTARTNYYKSFTLLQMANIKYLMGDIEFATDLARRAKDISPDYLEAKYRYTTYACKLIG